MKFLEDLTKLEKTTDTKEVIKKTKEIIETYLLESSTSEINISGKSKEKIIQGYTFQRENDSTWVFHTDPVELFQEIKKMVLGEMYHDPWRRLELQLSNRSFKNIKMIHLFALQILLNLLITKKIILIIRSSLIKISNLQKCFSKIISIGR
jgi:maltooligosyltrehalose synthase